MKAALISSVMLLAVPAFAHVPEIESENYGAVERMGGPDVSRATYGHLSELELYDDYEFTVDQAVTRTVRIIVPAYSEHSEFRPTVEITPEGGQPIVIEDPLDDPREREFEPFSLSDFWVGGAKEMSFEPGKTYRLRVSSTGVQSGRYVVVFSGPEEFDASDIAQTARILPAIWFGAYGGAPFRWNWYALIPITLVVAVLAAAAYVTWRLVRRLRNAA